ncbi:MAG: branched-chain amino acid transport system permease protein [Actinomycetota bacterium]|jgi:branched-chain amino acid transport system permease protein|nr:branched-chain amino acid transport system permease protein [Actinomycetota bacterium]
MRTAIVTGALVALIAAILFMGAGDPTGPNSYVVIGLSQGAVYGLVAIGLVLVYKGSRVFNFLQGEFGTLGAFAVFLMVQQWKVGLPYWACALIALAAVTIIGIGFERIVVRPLLNAPRITVLVATIATALFAIAMELLVFRPEPKILPPMVDSLFGKKGFEILSFTLEPQRFLIVLVLAGLAIGLGYFFSRTDLGLAVLATSQDPFATRVVGIGVERMSRFIWASAAFLGALAGILYVPLTGALTPGAMTTGILIPAFTAAVIGGMTSLPGAFVGGLTVGLVQSLSNWAANHYTLGDRLLQDIIKGAPDVALTLALLIVLLARPQGLLGKEA